jgi:hypothetical protein
MNAHLQTAFAQIRADRAKQVREIEAGRKPLREYVRTLARPQLAELGQVILEEMYRRSPREDGDAIYVAMCDAQDALSDFANTIDFVAEGGQ